MGNTVQLQRRYVTAAELSFTVGVSEDVPGDGRDLASYRPCELAVKTIADRLGHANPTMTVNRYLHVSASVSRQAVDVLDLALTPKMTTLIPYAQ